MSALRWPRWLPKLQRIDNDDDERNLPWLIFGRYIRPYSFAAAFGGVVLSVAVMRHSAEGLLLDQLPGHIVGVVAGISTVMLTLGWWWRYDRLMTLGLLWSAVSWAGTASILWTEFGWGNVSAWISFVLLLASGGAWLLERSHLRAVS